MKKYFFVDLDDTLFQTEAKCLGDECLQPAAYLKDGAACSFTTLKQRTFFESMSREMTLIPTTARNRDAFSRVGLPFSSYAILNYGGVILDENGDVDPVWLSQMERDMVPYFNDLTFVMHEIENYSSLQGLSARSRIISDCGLSFYVVVKDVEKDPSVLDKIQKDIVEPWAQAQNGAYFVHRNGNNLAILPCVLNKARALLYLREKLIGEHGPIVTVGMGDSHVDAQFLAACDYAIIPGKTQLSSMTVAGL